MAHSQHSEFSSMKAAADYRAKQYCGVTQTGDQEVTLAGANAVIFGIINNKPNINETAEVVRANSGIITKAKAGDAISRGNPVTTEAGGTFVVATTGQNACGYAMRDAADGDVFPVRLAPHTV